MTTPFSVPNSKQSVVAPGQNTGLMDRVWYRFFQDLFQNTGSGTINIGGLPASIQNADNLAALALNKRDESTRVAELERRLKQLEAYTYSLRHG